ncbi:MAG: hypothetical protein HUU55_23585 [Myxococcales bacterium]|nr:hypothetical protein [Myxococcales bacterium]
MKKTTVFKPVFSFGIVLALLLFVSCAETLPDDVYGYRQNCVRLNDQPIPPTDDDPHRGTKNVYACNITVSELEAGVFPYPDGTLIVKESTKTGQDYTWLIATARKSGSDWSWDEYKRNFGNEDFYRIPVSESVCTDCHKKAKESDYIFTTFEP